MLTVLMKLSQNVTKVLNPSWIWKRLLYSQIYMEAIAVS